MDFFTCLTTFDTALYIGNNIPCFWLGSRGSQRLWFGAQVLTSGSSEFILRKAVIEEIYAQGHKTVLSVSNRHFCNKYFGPVELTNPEEKSEGTTKIISTSNHQQNQLSHSKNHSSVCGSPEMTDKRIEPRLN
jgi:hypothetical protein